MARKTFNQFNEMSMSVTLKPKKNNMYKVTGVGSKMKAHGGIKKGEKFHDSEIDGMHDSGIKVKYQKPKKMNERNTGVKTADYKIKMKMPKDSDFKPIPGHPDYKGPQNPKPKIKLNKSPGNMKNEAIQRRMDRKVIIATDPATGRKVVKVAPKREIDIGKGRMESVEVNELDTSTIASYQKKAGKEYSKYKKSDRMKHSHAQGLADAGKTTQDHADKMSKNQDKYQKRGEGLAKSKKILAKRYSDKQVRMGKGVAFDKRYKGGNMTGASKAINKIKKGLADHPKVSRALRTANEQFINQEGE